MENSHLSKLQKTRKLFLKGTLRVWGNNHLIKSYIRGVTHGLNQPSQQKLQIERGLHQQKHRQFELKGHRNWNGMKESPTTSWPLQTGPRSHSAAKVRYSSRKGKSDPEGISEIRDPTTTTGPG